MSVTFTAAHREGVSADDLVYRVSWVCEGTPVHVAADYESSLLLLAAANALTEVPGCICGFCTVYGPELAIGQPASQDAPR